MLHELKIVFLLLVSKKIYLFDKLYTKLSQIFPNFAFLDVGYKC
jgi:hypothetical protein